MKPFYNLKVKESEMKKDLKITGFKTPEKYFDNFEAELFARISQENLPKSTGFQVPSGYFDILQEKVITKEFPLEKRETVLSLMSKRNVGYAAAIAASIIIGIGLFNWNQNISTIDSIQLGLIDKYIDDGNLNMDLYDLTTYFETSEISLEDFETQQLSQTTLKNYLMDTMTDEILWED